MDSLQWEMEHKNKLEKIIENLSSEIKSYLDMVENKTKFNIAITATSFLQNGMPAVFSYNLENKDMNITLVLERIKNNEDLNYYIIHEATHGLLFFGQDFANLKGFVAVTEKEKCLRDLLMTMVDDIVVNSICDKYGVGPFPSVYLEVVEREIKQINENNYNHPSKYKVSRYISAWSFIEYFNLDQNNISILQEYLNVFQAKFNDEYHECREIIKIIQKNDIFSPNGNSAICEGVAKLWGLNEKMKMTKLI